MYWQIAVDETGRGIYEDKAVKNMYASEYIWNSIKYDKPVGVICGVTPTTNPTSITIFKAPYRSLDSQLYCLCLPPISSKIICRGSSYRP